ncbi:hypothetical protein M407DRAFT_33890 [Tulasnella calospora MUT 4182]|uniref:Uncharacterized protein n=1 Tax=Tulasnella calospora MUT 4182 TaxID=1051891 RepID=A0A0C3PPN7_9AGAM|nr:hypothetical protein M407DRAFT_33890 [Tulasnella calospora MUT 4182]
MTCLYCQDLQIPIQRRRLESSLRRFVPSSLSALIPPPVPRGVDGHRDPRLITLRIIGPAQQHLYLNLFTNLAHDSVIALLQRLRASTLRLRTNRKSLNCYSGKPLQFALPSSDPPYKATISVGKGAPSKVSTNQAYLFFKPASPRILRWLLLQQLPGPSKLERGYSVLYPILDSGEGNLVPVPDIWGALVHDNPNSSPQAGVVIAFEHMANGTQMAKLELDMGRTVTVRVSVLTLGI